MHLKENTLFDLWPWGQSQMKCCPVPSTSCDLCTCKVWSCYIQWFRRRCICKEIHYLTFDLDIKVKWNDAQYLLGSLHHVTYAPAKFEVATSIGLGGDAFTRKYIIWPWPLLKVTRNVAQESVPSTSYDLFTCKVWSCYEEMHLQETWRTYTQTGGQRTDRLWYKVNIPSYSNLYYTNKLSKELFL